MNRKELIGLALLASVILIAALGPFLVATDPNAQDLTATLQPPGATFLLGSDHLGRSVLSRLVHGARYSLALSVACVAVAASVGVALGLVAAWYRGIVGALVMRATDVAMAFPGLLLALLLGGLFGGGLWPMLIGLKLTLWPQYARLVRAIAESHLARPHVEAAVLAGYSSSFILTRHVLPPLLPQIALLATLGVGNAVLSIASLGFLGIGLQPPTPEWGSMVSETLPYYVEAPVLVIAPSLLIFATVLGLHLLGHGLARRAAEV